MEKEKQTKELEIALTTYIAMEHNQDECSGFIDGFKEAMKLINKDSVLHSIIGSYLEEKSKEHDVDKNKLLIGLQFGDLHIQRFDTGAYQVWKNLEIIKI